MLPESGPDVTDRSASAHAGGTGAMASGPAGGPLRVLVGLGGAIATGLWLVVVALRASHPYPLEWQEGGMLLHVERVRQGLPLFMEPSLDFTPFPYPPLYVQLTSLLPDLGAGGFLGARLVSIVASLVTGLLLARGIAGVRGGRDRVAGLAAAGVWFAGYGYAGTWMDVARVDALAWALALGAFVAARRAHQTPALLVAGALAVAACWTKQTAAIPLGALAIGLLLERGRAGWAFAAAFGVGNLALFLLADAVTDGWSTFHLVRLLRGHPVHTPGLASFWTHDLAWLLPSLAVAGLTLRRSGAATIAFVVGALVAAGLGRAHIGAFDNVRLPALLVAAWCVGEGLARHGSQAETARGRTFGVTVLALLQFVLLARDPRGWIPTAADRADGDRVVAELADRPGPVLVLGAPHLAVRAGHPPMLHLMTWLDLSASEAGWEHATRLNEDLARRATLGEIRTVVVGDGQDGNEALRTFVGSLFRLDHDLWVGDGAAERFRPVTGAPARPRWIYVRP